MDANRPRPSDMIGAALLFLFLVGMVVLLVGAEALGTLGRHTA
jgi:hypothetical protein